MADREKAIVTAERAKRQNRGVLATIVGQVQEALREVAGISGAPTRREIREKIKFVMEEFAEEQPEERFFVMGGFVIEVDRNPRHWDTFRVLVPATKNMIWYREDDD